MELKILISGFLFMGFTLSCIEPVVDTTTLEKNQPVNFKLKSGIIGNKYYISKTGSNSNTGAPSAPFLTIDKGLSVAMAGDTVFVKSGTYQEYVRFYSSGQAGSPIVLSNYGTDVVTIDGAATNIFCIYSKDQSFISVKGLRCRNATAYNIKFEDCSNVTVDGCSVTMTTKSESVEGIVIDNNTRHSNYLIKNCTATNGPRGVAIWNNVSYATVLGGEFSYNSVNIGIGGGYPLNMATIPTYITIDGAYAHHSVTSNIGMENCQYVTIKNCRTNMGGATGIQVETNSSNALIEDNLCENNSRNYEYETGIWIYNSANAVVRRNRVRNNQTGLRFRNSSNFAAYYNIIEYNNYKPTSSPETHNTSGVDFSQSSGTFYNNTLVGNCASGSSLSSIFVYPDGINNIVTKNNIIFNDGGPQDMAFGQTTVSDYNLVYNANRAINIEIAGSPYSWSAYKTSRGQDANSININPVFVSVSDYKLQSTSTVINAGINVGLTSDYLKNSIVGQPDIGAIEYTGSKMMTTIYFNTQISVTALKNDCGTDLAGTEVTYTILASKYNSLVSQVDADNKALADLNSNKQTYANTNGSCVVAPLSATYYNTQISGTAVRNDCGAGYTGSTVTYTVAAKKYSSSVSQLRADNKALDDLNMNKQANANANGTCTRTAVSASFYNMQISAIATKNDCGTGYMGSEVTYTVPAGKYTSTQTQLRANNKALEDLNLNL